MANYIKALALSTFNSASMTGSYQAINGSGLQHPCVLLRIVNSSNQDITVSYDGTTDNEYVRAGEALTLPFQAQNLPSGRVSVMRKGTILYVKGTAGAGTIALTGYYQENV